jgi:chromosome segregation ATPase
MIQLPIEIGDVILAGRFKNKKITVKEIGVDDLGLPTINGRGILKIRIAKLMPEKGKEVKKESKLESLLKRLIREERQRLHELEITDPEIEQKIAEYARISDQMDRLKAELEALKKQYTPLDDELTALMEQADAQGDRALETKELLITIKKRGYEAKSPAYKEAFQELLKKVNGKMKAQAIAILDANTTMKRVSTSIGVQKRQTESRITEAGFLQNIYEKIKKFISNKVQFLFRNGKELDSDIAKMKQMIER